MVPTPSKSPYTLSKAKSFITVSNNLNNMRTLFIENSLLKGIFSIQKAKFSQIFLLYGVVVMNDACRKKPTKDEGSLEISKTQHLTIPIL